MSTTDKQGTKRSQKSEKKKKINITKLARKLQATAEMMHAGLGNFGTKFALINVSFNKLKKRLRLGLI